MLDFFYNIRNDPASNALDSLAAQELKEGFHSGRTGLEGVDSPFFLALILARRHSLSSL